FSVYLFDAQGRTLITRRALGKVAWPGVWSNSCCGHPRPGESTPEAIARRVREELGVQVRDLSVLLPDFRYRAVDASGIVEHEVCPVYFGRVDHDPSPDPDEVMDYAWVPWPQAVDALTCAPAVFSPWMGLQVPLLSRDLPSLPTPAAPHTPAVHETLGAVDRLLQEEARWAQGVWASTGLQPEDDPILKQDLPTWLGALVAGRGKMIRPRMCHWGYVAAGAAADTQSYADLCRAAAALEMLHVFALIHDDVMDESTWRRGRPAAHAQARDWHAETGGHGSATRFGDNIAILLGDLAHMQADRLVAGLPQDFRDAWHELCAELIAGQGADLTGAATESRSYEQADRVARLKSGSYTIERPLLLGALAGGVDASGQAALRSYGRQLGQAFALRDDILGVWGDPAVTGKPGGDDLCSRKPTVLWMLAQERLVGSGLKALHRVGTATEGSDDVRIVQQAMVDAGIRDEAEGRVSHLVEQALTDLQTDSLTAEGTEGLRLMAERVAWRES
ncbi:MAG: isopentenyl-diphosphate Delta-isomerase, partial [Ornithinimicrobium sp.]